MYSKHLKSTHQLTSPQLLALLAVAEKSHLTTTEIAQRVYLSTSTIVGILDRLEKKSLVKRERDIYDRRIVNVTITENGKEVANNAPSPLQENLARSLGQLPELEQATIALSLKRIVDLMEADHLEAAPILDTAPADLHNAENDPSPT